MVSYKDMLCFIFSENGKEIDRLVEVLDPNLLNFLRIITSKKERSDFKLMSSLILANYETVIKDTISKDLRERKENNDELVKNISEEDIYSIDPEPDIYNITYDNKYFKEIFQLIIDKKNSDSNMKKILDDFFNELSKSKELL